MKDKINKIIVYLDELYPDARCELEYQKDYELLIATVLSAQCTDKRVNEVTKVLFQKYDLDDFHEVVFCGFGEPLERVEDVIQIAGILKHFRRDLPIRVNTNGLACLIHQRDVTPEFKGRIDTVSISLNAPDAKEYDALTRSRFGIESFQAMLDFSKSCLEYVPFVVMSVVDIIGEEKIKKCQAICDDLGVTLRVRPFEE